MSDERTPYSGRLSFDPDSNFHTDLEGNPVVTLDGGKTWFYAVASDTSHYDRYHQQHLTVRGTNWEEEPEAHHFAVQPDDAHVDGLKFSPDTFAVKETGHTEAWS